MNFGVHSCLTGEQSIKNGERVFSLDGCTVGSVFRVNQTLTLTRMRIRADTIADPHAHGQKRRMMSRHSQSIYSFKKSRLLVFFPTAELAPG